MASIFNKNATDRIRRVVKKVEGNRSPLFNNKAKQSKYDDWFWAIVRNDDTYEPLNGWYTVISASVDAVADAAPTFTERVSSDKKYLEVRALNISEAITASGDILDGEPTRVYVASDTNNEIYYYFEQSGGDALWAEITSATGIGDNRWAYGIAQVEYLKEGTWDTVIGGITGVGYNSIETPNGATGVQGNGVDVANLPSGVEIVPLGVGAVVRAYPVTNCDTGGTEYVLEAVNQVDGTCA